MCYHWKRGGDWPKCTRGSQGFLTTVSEDTNYFLKSSNYLKKKKVQKGKSPILIISYGFIYYQLTLSSQWSHGVGIIIISPLQMRKLRPQGCEKFSRSHWLNVGPRLETRLAPEPTLFTTISLETGNVKTMNMHLLLLWLKNLHTM